MIKRKTHEEFVQEVYELVGNEYSVMGDYINNYTKILMRHNCKECNFHEWEMEPRSFLRGTRCPKCAGKMKKNTEIFKQEVHDLYGDEYSVMGEYVNTKTKILIKHNTCNHEWDVFPFSFLGGYTHCPVCSGKVRTTESFKKEIFDLVGEEYSVLDNYEGTEIPILMRHNVCNHEWSVAPNNFIVHNSRCPKCAGNAKKTTEIFKQEVQALYGDEYTVLGTYKRNDAKILMRHNCNKCNNYEWSVSPVSFLTGKAHCPVCSGKMKTTESFKNEVYDLVQDSYSVLGEYVNAKTKILVRHNKCNHEYLVRPNDFLQGSRCPICSRKNNKK